jgi:hypothetical protein
MPPSTAERADLRAALSGTVGKPEFEIRSALRRAAADLEPKDVDLSRFYSLLGLAFNAPLRAQRVPDPFEPLVVIEGRRSIVPGDLSQSQLEVLAAAVGLYPDDPAFDARLGDVLWVCRYKGRRDPTYARLAVEAYVASARVRAGIGEGAYDAATHLERALRLSFLVDSRGHLDLHEPARLAAREAAFTLEANGSWAALLRVHALMREFDIGEAREHAEACETIATDSASAEPGGIREQFLIEASAWWKRTDDSERGLQVIERRLNLKLEQAESVAAASASNATGLMQEAVKIVRLLPVARRGDREQKIRARLAEIEPRTLSEMGRIEHTIDVADLVQHAEDATLGKPLIDALLEMARMCAPQKVERIRQSVQQHARSAPLMHMMSASLMDSTGKVVATIPSLMSENASERDRAMRYHMVTEANRNQDLTGRVMIEAARRIIAAEHILSDAAILPLMWRSGFVPSGREGQWARAISAALSGEFEVATHLLLPQLEHALRMVVRAAGNPAAGMDRMTQQEDWTMNQMLLDEGRPILERVFGADVVFDLAALLVDRTGTNLRNAIAHGLIGGRVDGGPPRYLLGVCLRLIFTMIHSEPTEASSPNLAGEAPA